ncbi:MAG: Radical domain protein [Acidimicrobiales bacterium]|nr:Radical domain protein [Acidimicrobiales bacterium]
MPTPVAAPRRLSAAPAAAAVVTLVRPPVVTLPGSLATHGPVPPVGLAYIAAVLRDDGHHVRVIDAPMAEVGRFARMDSPIGPLELTGLSPAEIVERIEPDTQVLGITNMFLHEWPQVRDIAERARARFPHLLIVVGGETPTAFWRHIFAECEAVDCCVLGEGETTVLEVVARVAEQRPIAGVEGLVTRDGAADGSEAGGLPTRLRKLDAVPRPAWDLFPLEHYWHGGPFFGVDRGRSMPMLATRGCPYRCTFCSSPQMWTTRYVVREPADVVDEIADYVERYGVRNINFCDLTAITKRNWTLEFCDELDARGLDITWQLPVGTRSEALDADVLQRLWETGCRNITYAPESGSPRMLEVMDKKVDLDHMLTSLRAAHRIGLKTHVNIIIGHPEERWRDVAQSMRLLLQAARIGCEDAAPSIFAPYPGSKDFADLVDQGVLTVDEATHYVSFSRSTSASRSYNPTMSARQLRAVQLAMLVLFYGVSVVLHPARLWRLVRTPFRGGETTYLEQMLRTRRQDRRQRQHPASASIPLS